MSIFHHGLRIHYVDFKSSSLKSLIIQLRKPRVNILSDVTRSKGARTARELLTFFLNQLGFFSSNFYYFQEYEYRFKSLKLYQNMGVIGLWSLLEPAGKPVPLESLENKILAIGKLHKSQITVKNIFIKFLP